jgi:sulfur relay (sulfurtransferase) DsrF/TusC family protein
MSLSVDIDGLGDTLTNLAGLPAEIESEAQKNLNEAAEVGARVAKRNLDQKTSPYGTHDSEEIIETKYAVRGMEAKVDTSGAVTIKDGFNYLLSIEFGARPHFPPVERLTGKEEALDRWVKRMNPTPRTKRQAEMDQSELNEDVAFLIARSISNRGLKERAFMRSGKNMAAAKLKKEMESFDTSKLAL